MNFCRSDEAQRVQRLGPMPELTSLCLVIDRLRFTAPLNIDVHGERAKLIGPPELIDLAQTEVDDDLVRRSFSG